MARSRSAGYDSQRDRIADQAVRSFARRGYASATMGAIAQDCGISKANLYHYFRGKDALLFHALERYTGALEALARHSGAYPQNSEPQAEPGNAEPRPPDPQPCDPQPCDPRQAAERRRLEQLIADFVQAYSDAAHYHKALLNDVHHLPETSRERIRALERQIVAHFQRAIVHAYPRLGDHPHPGALTLSLLGMLNFSFAWWRPEGGLDASAFAREIALLWHGALGARAKGLLRGEASADPPTASPAVAFTDSPDALGEFPD